MRLISNGSMMYYELRVLPFKYKKLPYLCNRVSRVTNDPHLGWFTHKNALKRDYEKYPPPRPFIDRDEWIFHRSIEDWPSGFQAKGRLWAWPCGRDFCGLGNSSLCSLGPCPPQGHAHNATPTNVPLLGTQKANSRSIDEKSTHLDL